MKLLGIVFSCDIDTKLGWYYATTPFQASAIRHESNPARFSGFVEGGGHVRTGTAGLICQCLLPLLDTVACLVLRHRPRAESRRKVDHRVRLQHKAASFQRGSPPRGRSPDRLGGESKAQLWILLHVRRDQVGRYPYEVGLGRLLRTAETAVERLSRRYAGQLTRSRAHTDGGTAGGPLLSFHR